MQTLVVPLLPQFPRLLSASPATDESSAENSSGGACSTSSNVAMTRRSAPAGSGAASRHGSSP